MSEGYIFRGKDLSCRESLSTSSDSTLVVTFQQRMAKDSDFSENQIGFGESYLKARNINAIHILSHWNHWYQTPEIFDCIRSILNSRLYRDARRVVLYGSSMGAYGALLHMNALQPQRVVAISPLYSIDPVKVEFESRWNRDLDGISFISDDMPPLSLKSGEVFVLYDPKSLDFNHVQRFCLENVELLEMPFSGHPVSKFLSECGVLSKVSSKLVLGETVDTKEVRELLGEAYGNRRLSSSYLINLYRYVRQVRGGVLAKTLLERGAREFPDDNFFSSKI